MLKQHDELSIDIAFATAARRNKRENTERAVRDDCHYTECLNYYHELMTFMDFI